MNKWLVSALIVLVILIGIGMAYDQGLFGELSGGRMATILAILAAPYMAIKKTLFGNKELREFEAKYKELGEQEVEHRKSLDTKIHAKEQRVLELDREIQLLDSKLEVLELKKAKVKKEVDNMTIDETKNEIVDLFGN